MSYDVVVEPCGSHSALSTVHARQSKKKDWMGETSDETIIDSESHLLTSTHSAETLFCLKNAFPYVQRSLSP